MPSECMGFNQIKYFLKLIPRPLNNFNRELFVLYKYAVIGSITIRIVENNDLALIENFLRAVLRCKIILKDIIDAVDEYNETQSVFPILILNCGVVVGIFLAR